MINYFKSAERLLLERGNLDRALANIEHRLERAVRETAPSGIASIDYSKTYVSQSDTADALSVCLAVAELTREISTTKETIKEIDDVLAQLSDEDAEILSAWYIEGKTKSDIAEQFSYSSRTSIYDLRNKAVAAFALLYFGAAALSST